MQNAGPSIAVIQMQSGDDVGRNLECARTLCARAAGRGARLLVLPENFAFFGTEAQKLAHQEELQRGPVGEALAEIASAHRVTVVGGGFPERSSDPTRPYNTSVVVGPDGAVVASYRKLHLFDVVLPDGMRYAESSRTSAGQGRQTFSWEGITVGLSICYDLRFPALYQALSEDGATLLLVTAAFTEQTGMAHWETLLRARAIENTAYVAAAAQWGGHPGGRRTFGHSAIYDPWGTLVAGCGEGEGVAVGEIDGRYLEQVRRRLPCLGHRRPVD
jgi:deaminated glutathione amidase